MILTNDSVLLESVQQAGGELLKVEGKSGAVFDFSENFDEHRGRHREAIIALENISSSIAFLQMWSDARLGVEWGGVLGQTC